MPPEKKSDSPNEDKSIGDSSALHPVLTDYLALHPQFSLDTFLGDAAFDTTETYIETYGFLKDEFHFSKALIPYNVGTKVLSLKSAITFTVIPPAQMTFSLP